MRARVRQLLALLAAGVMGTATCTQDQVDDQGEQASRRAMPDPAPPPSAVSSGLSARPTPPSLTADPSATVPTTSTCVTQSPQYAEDEIIGVLHVTPAAAYYQIGETTISVVQAPAVTGRGSSALMAETAGALRHFIGKRVRTRGDLQGAILWEAQVVPSE
jgi:hypothetical protein